MLRLLEYMVGDSEEPYSGILWQLLCGPFTPFLELFGEIVSNGKGKSEENQEALIDLERLPVFLRKMSLRNSLAGKLERIAVVFVQHAKSVIQPDGRYSSGALRASIKESDHCSSAGTHAGEDAPGQAVRFERCPIPGHRLGTCYIGTHSSTTP